jgi:hypothetical protein
MFRRMIAVMASSSAPATGETVNDGAQVEPTGWGKLSTRLQKWLCRYVWPSFVLASVVHLLSTFHVPLELPAALLASRVSWLYAGSGKPANQDARSTLALVTITQETFDGRYRGQSPLDRCRLAEDLDELLKRPGIETVAVDIFLSPVASDRYHPCCRAQLEKLLKGAPPGKLIAILETTPENIVWSKQFPGVAFTDPNISTSFGVAKHHDVSKDKVGLASALAVRLCSPSNLPAPEFCQAGQKDGHFQDDGKVAHRKNSINFGEVKNLYNNGLPISIEEAVVASEKSKVRHVLFGGEYGSDDNYDTPVGPKYGVAIHAAIAAQPRAHEAHWRSFLLDVAMGLAFGLLIRRMWTRYFNQRLEITTEGSKLQAPAVVFGGSSTRIASAWRTVPDLAYLQICILVFVYLLLVALFVVLSAFGYAHYAVWISPVPMAIGMAFEALVAGSVHAALHMKGSPDATAPKAATDEPQEIATARGAAGERDKGLSKWQHFLIGAPTAFGVVLVVLAVLDLQEWWP